MDPKNFAKMSTRFRASNSFCPTPLLMTDETMPILIERICRDAVSRMLRDWAIQRHGLTQVEGPAGTGE